MKIDYEITVCVRGMSVKKKRKVQDAFFKLGIDHAKVTKDTFESCLYMTNWYGCAQERVWCMMGSYYKATHTYTQLLELANMTDKKQLTDLNSDELRTKLAKNTGKMTKLKLQNDEIVELLRSRALAPIDVDDKVALTGEELKCGEWWMASATQHDKDCFIEKGIGVEIVPWVGNKYTACSLLGSEVTAWVSGNIESKPKQIHRIGNNFYWGAP